MAVAEVRRQGRQQGLHVKPRGVPLGQSPHCEGVPQVVETRSLALVAAELDREGRGIQISQVVPFPWDSSVPVVKEYRALLAAAKAEPGFGTLEGYIAAKVMAEGLRRAGRNLTRESFITAMESLSPYDAGGFKVSYGPDDHNGSTFVDLTIISKNQTFVR